jgi:hypothetical protein
MMSGWRTLVVAAALAATLGAPRAVRAEEYPNEAGWGALSVLSNIGYMPAKSVYAVVGGLTGGIAYACTAGNYETASNIWEMSLGGTWALSPAMLRGEEGIYFAGGPTATSAAAASAPSTYGEGDTDTAATDNSRREESLPPS